MKDDQADLIELHAAIEALGKAQDALRAAMVGQGPRNREEFAFQVGFARGRLSRISSRIYGETEIEHSGDSDP